MSAVVTDEEDCCPLCGLDVRLLLDYDEFGIDGPVLRRHVARPGGPTRLRTSVCLGSYMEVAYAQAVADARAENGGRLLRAAHP